MVTVGALVGRVVGMDRDRARERGREVVEEVREHDVTFMAGSIAHSAFLSLLPLLLLLLIVVAAVGNEYLTERIVAMSREYLSPAGEGLVVEALTDASERAGASAIGVVSLVWGMLRIFRGLNTAFDELYGEADSSIVTGIVDGLVVFACIVLATVGAGLGAAALTLSDRAVVQALNPLVLACALMVAFFPIYYVFPEPDVGVREALPGTIVAAVGWVALEVVFGIYVDLVNTVTMYGTMGAIIVLLIWLYASAFVLLFSATVNVVLAGRHRADEAAGSTRETPQSGDRPVGGLE